MAASQPSNHDDHDDNAAETSINSDRFNNRSEDWRESNAVRQLTCWDCVTKLCGSAATKPADPLTSFRDRCSDCGTIACHHQSSYSCNSPVYRHTKHTSNAFSFCLTDLFLRVTQTRSQIIGAGCFTGWMPFLSTMSEHHKKQNTSQIHIMITKVLTNKSKWALGNCQVYSSLKKIMAVWKYTDKI